MPGRILRDGTNTTVDLSTAGYVEIDAPVASEAEALAGTNNDKAMTPLRVAQRTIHGDATLFATASTLAAVLAAAPAGAEILVGRTSTPIAGTFTVSTDDITIRGGVFGDAARSFVVTGDRVTFDGVSVDRTGGTADLGAAITWAGEHGRLLNCDVASAVGPALSFSSGSANYTRVEGGRYESSSVGSVLAISDGAVILGQASAAQNVGLHIAPDLIVNSGYGSGIVLYNCSDCHTVNVTMDGIRRSPLETVAGAWTNTAGNVWRTLLADHRTDTTPNAIYNNAVEVVEDNTPSSTTPAANRYTTPGDGYLYLNLNGTDPNGRTITTTRTNGYGVLYYSTSSLTGDMTDNTVERCTIVDTDNIGIYFQMLVGTPKRNKTFHNTLRDVCLEGKTVANLPCAGIGFFGGEDVTMVGDTVTVAGATGKAVPGIRFKPNTTAMSAKLSDVTVSGGTENGITFSATASVAFTGRLTACVSKDNTGSGLVAVNSTVGALLNVTTVACRFSGNTASGVSIDPSSTGTEAGAYYDFGSTATGNTSRGWDVRDIAEVKLNGSISDTNGAGQYGMIFVNITRLSLVNPSTIGAGLGISWDSACEQVFYSGHMTDGAAELTAGTAYRIAGNQGQVATYVGAGTPEAAVTAAIGSTFRRSDGGAATSLYVKESGTGNTGWAAK